MPDSGALRLARAAGLGVSAFALSLAAHVAAGGQAPSATASVLLLLATVWVSIFLTGRRLGWAGMTAAVGVSQLVLHQLFAWATPAGSCMTVVHSHADHLTNGAVTICSQGAGLTHHGSSGLVMTVAHAMAAVLLGLLLARGEAAVWFLARLVWPRVPAAPVFVHPTVLAAVALVAQWSMRPTIRSGGGGRRGPPVTAAACPEPSFTA
jgi:hypothetical protein